MFSTEPALHRKCFSLKSFQQKIFNVSSMIPANLKNTDQLSLEGLEKFLAGSYIKGTGPVYARKLAEAFGFDLLKPDFDWQQAVQIVKGLSEKHITNVVESLGALKFPVEAAILLYSAGLSDIEVEKILSHYGKNALLALTEDPYDMVENAWKVSFFTADKLGRWLEIASDDQRRLRGALLTAVKFYAEKGSLFADEQQALRTAASLTGQPIENLRPALDSLIDEERLVRSHDGIYLPVYYNAEKETAKKLKSLIIKNKEIAEDYEIPTVDIEGNPLNAGQLEALRTVMNHPVTIITGGPGTGKTTTVSGIINLFEGMDKKVILVAPTGRAAKRLADLSGSDAKTIHRLLGYSMGKGYRNKRLEADILVIDEASMLEQVMFNHLLDALDNDIRIVLVGDTNQLPAIGAGDVLNELIASGKIPVVRLSENFRQKAGSRIAANAEAIKKGRNLSSDASRDFILITESNPEKSLRKVLNLVAEELPARFGIDPKDIQVVTPQQDGQYGARELNLEIQRRVNPDGPCVKSGMKTFRLNDRVMQTTNSSEYNVYNGETGWISDVDEIASTLEVTFYDGKKIRYGRDRFKELSLAYATTVHKLQGSETDYMVMLLTTAHRNMLYRNLLYTGISRAKKLCVLVAEQKALDTALANDAPAKRNSNLCLRLQ